MNIKEGIPAWLRTRPYRRLWRSGPALAVVSACAAFGLVLLCWSPVRIARSYDTVVDRALTRHDFNTALVASQRQLALKIWPRSEVLFKMAESLDGLGQHQEAFALMNSLAPGDHPGYAPAHLVMAETLLRGSKLTAPELRAVELHLAYVNELEPYSPVAQAMLKYLHAQFQAWEAGTTNHLSLDPDSLATHEVAGWVFFQSRDWQAAKPHLLAEVDANPTVNFMLADLAAATGDQAGVRHWNEQAERAYHDKVANARGDAPADRIAWAQSAMRLGQYDAARQILENGQKLSGTNVYAPALGELYAAWVQALSQDEPTNLAARLQCLQQGLAADSTSSRLLLQLDALSRLKGPEAKTAQDMFNRLLADGPLVPFRLAIFGMAAWQQGDQETARKYTSRAFQLAPNQPEIANNMAMMMALGDSPDLDRALEIVQSVLDKYPEQPHFRETRGEIYIQMGRYEDGVRDLEYALPRLSHPQGTLKTLGRAYRLLYANHPDQRFLDAAFHYEELAAGTNSPVPAHH